MSESFEHFKAAMPKKCLTSCQLFQSCLNAAAHAETIAQQTTQNAAISLDRELSDTSGEDSGFKELRTALLKQVTDRELVTRKRLSNLAEHGAECPTPRRGLPPGAALSQRALSWVANQTYCQNPGRFINPTS